MTNLTPEQLAEKGLELVPWETLAEVKLDAWYRFVDPEDGDYWRKIDRVHKDAERFSMGFLWINMHEFTRLEHSTDNGKTWHPCTSVRPIGGRLEHEKILREDLRPNQEAKQ